MRSTLFILRSLLRTTYQAGVRTFEPLPSGELQLPFDVAELRAMGNLVGQLEALRTPFSATISAEDADCGRLRATWDRGLDQPSVVILGKLPEDPERRRTLLSRLEELLGG